MTRRVWRQVRKPDGTSELVELENPPPRLPSDLRFDEPFISPVDGSVIRNKYDLVAHNSRNGVMQILPGVEQDWQQRRKERMDPITGKTGKNQRIEALKRAMERHNA